MFGPRWYAVSYSSGHAPNILADLRAQGFKATWPRVMAEAAYRAEREIVEPLFPGFLFARFDLADPRWPLVSHTPRVRGLICDPASRLPIPAPLRYVERLLVLAGGMNGIIERRAKPGTGERRLPKQAVVSAMMGGRAVEAQVELDDGKARVGVMMTMFGTKRVVMVPRELVRAAA